MKISTRAEIQPGLKFFPRNRKSRFILYLQGPRAEISSRFAGLKLGLANSRGSWVVGRMSWVVGKKSWVVGKKSWVVGKKSWVVGKKSWVVGKKSWVPRKKSWVLRKKSWVPNKKSLVPRKSRGFQAKCFRIFPFSLLECVFFVF